MASEKCHPEKSNQDDRDYRSLRLSNGLKVVLISDPLTDKSGASLDVHVGHLSDPWEIPGLAHFLEHMLFLGTEKYPDENEYNQFLSLHGGSSNAYTDSDHTNFYFDVTPQHFEGTLDRFSQFFLQPLFTESATDRELKAVNSENDKNLASDAWRIMQLERSMSKEGHVYGKFGTGNSDTLEKDPKAKDMNVRDALLKFHGEWYSSNIMALAVLSNETLDELEALVLKYFEGVVDKKVSVPEWQDHPYIEEASMVHLTPIKDIRQLNLRFPIPDYSVHYLSKPVSYVSHLIGHEGKGSLLSELKSLGYVNQLVAGLKEGAKGFSFFVVDVDLTETGIDKTDEIITLVFQYLQMLRQDGIKEWIFEECRHINDMQFRFKDKERPMNYVRTLALRLHDFPLGEILNGPWKMTEFKPDLIEDVLKRLIPQNLHAIIIGQSFSEITDQTEKWYGTKFKRQPISQDKLSSWTRLDTHPRLHLPAPNDFIPTDFELAKRDEDHTLGAIVPSILAETSLSRLWFLQDTEFLLPKACINIEILSPLAYASPHHSNLSTMFVRVFQDALTEYSYDAEMAGLEYSLSPTKYGMSLDIRGYHQKQDILLKVIMNKMKTFQVDETRFDVLKEAYVRALKNFEMEQPHTHATYGAQVLLTEKIWTKEEMLKAATEDDLTASALQLFIPQLLARVQVELFIHGNLTPEKAEDIMKIVESSLGPNVVALPRHAVNRGRQVALESKAVHHHIVENAIHKSSCIVTIFEVGSDQSRRNMLLELFSQIIREPCFNTLRTKEQLGYIVYSGVRKATGIYGLQVIVQSDKKPSYLDSRIENFLKETRELLEVSNKISF